MRENEIVNEKYKINNMIGKGGFGSVWEAINILNGEKVAIKCEEIEGNNKQTII